VIFDGVREVDLEDLGLVPRAEFVHDFTNHGIVGDYVALCWIRGPYEVPLTDWWDLGAQNHAVLALIEHFANEHLEVLSRLIEGVEVPARCVREVASAGHQKDNIWLVVRDGLVALNDLSQVVDRCCEVTLVGTPCNIRSLILCTNESHVVVSAGGSEQLEQLLSIPVALV
jgi:hypothetical protein